MLRHLHSFTHLESFGLLNQFIGKQFYLADLIDMQITLWSEKMVHSSFRNNVDKENSLFWEDKCNWWVFKLSNTTPPLTKWFIFQVNNNFVLFMQGKNHPNLIFIVVLYFCLQMPWLLSCHEPSVFHLKIYDLGVFISWTSSKSRAWNNNFL